MKTEGSLFFAGPVYFLRSQVFLGQAFGADQRVFSVRFRVTTEAVFLGFRVIRSGTGGGTRLGPIWRGRRGRGTGCVWTSFARAAQVIIVWVDRCADL